MNKPQQKKARGPTKFETVIPMTGNGPWSILWIKGQPHGRHVNSFAGALGTYARNSQYFPNHVEWGATHERSLVAIYYELEEKNYYKHETPKDPKNPGHFLPLDIDGNLTWCRISVQKKVRAWKSEVKREYYEKWLKLSPEDQENFVFDDRIDLDHWEDLVAYYEHPQKQKETEQNKINCEQSMATYTGGPISMVCYQDKLEAEMGDDYNKFKGYLKSHTKKKWRVS